MTDSALRREIEIAILLGRARWGRRQLEDVYARMEKASREGKAEIVRVQNSRFLFLTKYTFSIGFYEFVEGECAKRSMYRKLARALTKTIIAGIVHEGGADMRDFDRGTPAKEPAGSSDSEGGEGGYTRRHMQDVLRDLEPAEFVVGQAALPANVGDDRRRPVQSVHAPVSLPSSLWSSKAEESLANEHRLLASNPRLRWNKEAGDALRMASPTYVGNLVGFQRMVRQILSRESSKGPKEEERRQVLFELFGVLGPGLMALQHDVASQVALRWWFKRKPARHKELLDRGFPFHVSPERVKKVVESLELLGLGLTEAFGVFHIPAVKFEEIQQSEDAAVVWRSFAGLTELPSPLRAVATANAAVVLSRQGRWKLAQPLYAQALVLYDANGDSYGRAVALKNRGEFRIRAGIKAGNEDLEEAETIGKSLNPADRFAVHWNLAMANLRLKDVSKAHRHLKRCLDDRDHVDPERVLLVCDLVDATRG